MKTWLVTTENDPSCGITVEAETPKEAGDKAREKFPDAVLIVYEMILDKPHLAGRETREA